MNYTALLKIEPMPLAWLKQALSLPEIELSYLPAKLSQRLWVGPAEFLEGHLSPRPGSVGGAGQRTVATRLA